MSRIRVAYLIDTIEPNFGGTETQLVRLIERIDRRRIEPVLCFLRDSQWFQENRELCRQYDVGFTSFFSLNSWKKFFEYVRFLRKANIDVLQTQFRDSNILGTIAAKLARIPVLIASRRNEGYWLNHLELAILHILNPFTTHFIVNSQSVKRYVQRVEHIASSKIEVIYNGVILDAFRSESNGVRDLVRSELEIPNEAKIVTLVGNLRPVKGIDMYLKSLRKVTSIQPNAHFLIVGEGSEREMLENICRESGLKEVVHFLGNRKDIPRLLKASDIGVLTSHSEGLSNALIEYLAAGLPVVCTNVGGNAEIVVDGHNGYVVPARDGAAIAEALCRLLSNLKLAKEMGENSAKRVAELFDIERCVERTTALYERLLGEKENAAATAPIANK